jgi:hypothetical protein
MCRKRDGALVQYAVEQVDQCQIGQFGFGFGGVGTQDQGGLGVRGEGLQDGGFTDPRRPVQQDAATGGEPGAGLVKDRAAADVGVGGREFTTDASLPLNGALTRASPGSLWRGDSGYTPACSALDPAPGPPRPGAVGGPREDGDVG